MSNVLWDYGERIVEPLGQGVRYLMDVLRSKEIVKQVVLIDNQTILISRKRGYSTIKLYIVDAYVLGVGATQEILNKQTDINAILVLSKWNQYTGDSKRYGLDRDVGIFSFDELMGAVYYNGKKFVNYRKPEKDKAE